MLELKYFKGSEFNCPHTNKNAMNEHFLLRLDKLRGICGFPFIINSGYRHPTHPLEAMKKTPGTGTHCRGIAVDIKMNDGRQLGIIIKNALGLGFKGFGVSRVSGSGGFIHLDMRESDTPIFWSYK